MAGASSGISPMIRREPSVPFAALGLQPSMCLDAFHQPTGSASFGFLNAQGSAFGRVMGVMELSSSTICPTSRAPFALRESSPLDKWFKHARTGGSSLHLLHPGQFFGGLAGNLRGICFYKTKQTCKSGLPWWCSAMRE